MSNETPATRYFYFSNNNGFARFETFPGNSWGELHVRGSKEKNWVLAGSETEDWISGEIASGRLVEFSPASLLGGVSSPAKALSSRINGAKGGRPRKTS